MPSLDLSPRRPMAGGARGVLAAMELPGLPPKAGAGGPIRFPVQTMRQSGPPRPGWHRLFGPAFMPGAFPSFAKDLPRC